MRQRHSPAHLFWRSVVASCSNAAMATGLYPLVPHAGAMARRWQSGDPGYAGQPLAAATEWALSVAVSATRPFGFLDLPASLIQGPRPVIFCRLEAS